MTSRDHFDVSDLLPFCILDIRTVDGEETACLLELCGGESLFQPGDTTLLGIADTRTPVAAGLADELLTRRFELIFNRPY